MVTVCQICGDRGFEEALVYCDSCKIAAMHFYCLGITPVPFEDYVIWFCEECDGSDYGSDREEVDMTTKLKDILKKKSKESCSHTSPVLAAEDNGVKDTRNVESEEVSSSPTNIEIMKEAEIRESLDNGKSDELTGLVRNEGSILEAGDGASALEKGGKENKKKKKKKKRRSIDHTLPVLPVEDRGISDAANVEPVEVSTNLQSSDELNGLVRNEATVLEAGDGASVPEKGERRKKKKKRKSITNSLPVLAVEDHELPDATNVEPVEVSTKRQSSEELNGLVRNEAAVLEAGDGASASEKADKEKKKKKKRKGISHSLPVLPIEDHELPDATNVEPVEVSKKRKSSEELNGLVRNEASVSEAGDGASVSEKGDEAKKKKKKKRKSINHSLLVLPDDDHELPDVTDTEPVEVSKKRQSPEELNDVSINEASVSEKGEKEKKKKKRKSINHSLPVCPVEDHELPDATIVEPVEVSKKRQSPEELNNESVLEKIEKKKKKKSSTTNREVKKNEESSNNTLPVLAVEDQGLQATDKETTDDSERQEKENGESHELTGLVKCAATSVSEAGNSSAVPDHSSCTSNKRKLSSGNIRVTSGNTQLEAESNMPRMSEKLTANDFNSPLLNNDRAQPILEPIWRGSISIKNRNISSISGLVAHVSNLACYQVHEKASLLHVSLSAEMVPRLEIWPKSFLKNGGPMDDSIALYFFPSSESDSNQKADLYSLVHEMKKNDLGMRCVVDNAELVFFTSYQLPMHCWTFNSKEYLWGAFKARKTC